MKNKPNYKTFFELSLFALKNNNNKKQFKFEYSVKGKLSVIVL